MSTISEALRRLREDVDELSAEEAAKEILKTTKYKESAQGNLAKLIAFWENESDVMPADAIEDYKEADSELSKKYGKELVSWVDTYEKGEDDPAEGSWYITAHLKNGKVKKLMGDYQGFLGIAELEEGIDPDVKQSNLKNAQKVKSSVSKLLAAHDSDKSFWSKHALIIGTDKFEYMCVFEDGDSKWCIEVIDFATNDLIDGDDYNDFTEFKNKVKELFDKFGGSLSYIRLIDVQDLNNTPFEWFDDDESWWTNNTVVIPSDTGFGAAFEVIYGFVPGKGYCIYSPDNGSASFVSFVEFVRDLRAYLNSENTDEDDPFEENVNIVDYVKDAYDQDIL